MPVDPAIVEKAKITPGVPLVAPGDEIKLMVFGNSGSGKTELLGTANEDSRTLPVIWVDLEGGTRTIRHKCNYLNPSGEDTWIDGLGSPKEGLIDVVRIRDFKDLQKIYGWLFDKRYRDQRAVYRSCVMDSLTEINYAGLKHCMANTTVARIEVDVPEQRDYLKLNSLMKDMMRGFRDLEGLHVFYSALPKSQEEVKGSNIEFIKPSLTGKLADEAVAIMDYVGYLRVKADRIKRELLFQPENRIVAKERSNRQRLIKILDDPTITTIMDAIEKSSSQLQKI